MPLLEELVKKGILEKEKAFPLEGEIKASGKNKEGIDLNQFPISDKEEVSPGDLF